jgi:hemerythrin
MIIKFSWDNSYSVDIALIDEQHRRFFEVANQAYAAAESGTTNRKELLALLLELNDYALFHLSTEENYFKQFFFVDAPLHVTMHDIYRARMNDFLLRARSESEDTQTLVREAADFAGNWLESHIMVMDKAYTQTFKEHGLR